MCHLCQELGVQGPRLGHLLGALLCLPTPRLEKWPWAPPVQSMRSLPQSSQSWSAASGGDGGCEVCMKHTAFMRGFWDSSKL